MDNELLSSVSIWEKLDAEVAKTRFSSERRMGFYPSEASVIATDPETGKKKILGGCMRKTWYRLLGAEQTEPTTVKTKYIFAFGDMIEDFIVDLIKRSGLYNNRSVKFWSASTKTSGEIDVVVDVGLQETEGKYMFVEIKSTYGAKVEKSGYLSGPNRSLFKHSVGAGRNKQWIDGQPKESALLQIVTYLLEHKDDENLIGGKILYLLRDNFLRTEFNVVLEYDENVGKHKILLNSRPVESFYAEDITARFDDLYKKIVVDYNEIQNGKTIDELEPPEQDFSLEYSEEEVEEKFADGDITKTAYDNFKKNPKANPVGDWQCSYCSYKSLCWNLEQKQMEAA